MFQEHLYSNRRCIGLTLLLWPHKGHRLKYELQIELCFKLQGRPYWFLFFFPNEVTVILLCWHEIKLKVSTGAEIMSRELPRLCFTILKKFLMLIFCPVSGSIPLKCGHPVQITMIPQLHFIHFVIFLQTWQPPWEDWIMCQVQARG